jgi:hypothetical protein
MIMPSAPFSRPQDIAKSCWQQIFHRRWIKLGKQVGIFPPQYHPPTPVNFHSDELQSVEKGNLIPIPLEDPDQQQLEGVQNECRSEDDKEKKRGDKQVDAPQPICEHVQARNAGEGAARDQDANTGGQQAGRQQAHQVEPRGNRLRDLA